MLPNFQSNDFLGTIKTPIAVLQNIGWGYTLTCVACIWDFLNPFSVCCNLKNHRTLQRRSEWTCFFQGCFWSGSKWCHFWGQHWKKKGFWRKHHWNFWCRVTFEKQVFVRGKIFPYACLTSNSQRPAASLSLHQQLSPLSCLGSNWTHPRKIGDLWNDKKMNCIAF